MLTITTHESTPRRTHVGYAYIVDPRSAIQLGATGSARAACVAMGREHPERRAIVLGRLILRAQRRDERHELTCNAGRDCAVCNAAFPV
jgi:hypothetical protein